MDNFENKLIDKLFKLEHKCIKSGDFPVAAIVYMDNKLISCGYNKRNKSNKTTDHAEIIAIEKACKKLHNWRLQDCEMIVTMEPCPMCENVIKEARLKTVKYILPRLEYKKQYKCTIFKNIEINTTVVEKYRKEIRDFFNDKR